jgi:hypothetical protein
MEPALCLATCATSGRTVTSRRNAASAAVAMPLSQYGLPILQVKLVLEEDRQIHLDDLTQRDGHASASQRGPAGPGG